MKHAILFASLITALGLSACDRPTVVTVPGPTVTVPGPAGPQGESGEQGAQGSTGYTGEQGEPGEGGTDTVVIVPVPAEQE